MTAHRLLNWLAACLICLVMGASWMLDLPSEFEAERATQAAKLDAQRNAVAQARFAQAARQACGGDNAAWMLRPDGTVQCATKRGHKTIVASVQANAQGDMR